MNKVVLGKVFLRVLQHLLVSVIALVLHTSLCCNITVISRTSRKSLGSFNQSSYFFSYQGVYAVSVVTSGSHVTGNHLQFFVSFDMYQPIKLTPWRESHLERSVIAHLFKFLVLYGV